MKPFNEILKAWLDYTGIKQTVIATRLGVKPSVVSQHVTKYRTPKIDTVAGYAKAFNVSVPEFLSGPPENEPYDYAHASSPVSRAAG